MFSSDGEESQYYDGVAERVAEVTLKQSNKINNLNNLFY